MRQADRVVKQRLHSQHLVSPTLTDAAAVVSMLGAVQAQDYLGARWAIAQRTKGLTESDVERTIASGRVVRTHVLRPTWHFVLPEDIRWMLALTAPRIRAAMAYHVRQLGLEPPTFRKSAVTLERALRDGKQLTRTELGAELLRAGVKATTGEQVGQLLMRAELDGLIVSGARRDKQFTYALLDERVAAAPARERDDALHELTQRYFATRGPATLRDFAWWSGLTVADAKRGVESAASLLERDGAVYWHASSRPASTRSQRVAHLLPNFDEYFVGFRDRSAIAERLRGVRKPSKVDALMGHVLCIDGQLVGGWRRTLGKTAEVEVRLLVRLTAAERTLVQRAAERFGRFLQLPVDVRSVAT